jgi:hypothetical protein
MILRVDLHHRETNRAGRVDEVGLLHCRPEAAECCGQGEDEDAALVPHRMFRFEQQRVGVNALSRVWPGALVEKFEAGITGLAWCAGRLSGYQQPGHVHLCVAHDGDFWLSMRLAPTPGGYYLTSMPTFSRCALSAMPLSWTG